MTLEFDEIGQYALESTIIPEVSKSSINQPEFDQKSPNHEGFEVSLPLEPINEVMVVTDKDDEEEVTFNNLRSDIPINEIKIVIDEDDKEVTFNNLRPDIPILITRKRKRLESESDPLMGLVRFFLIHFWKIIYYDFPLFFSQF